MLIANAATTTQAAGMTARENQVARLSKDRTMGYAEYGAPAGAPVFALHGTPGSRFMFQLADPLARERGLLLIAPERPGAGLSPPHRLRGLTSWAHDIAELADKLSIGRFAIIGVSGGGPYAAACTAELGKRVTRAGLVSPVGPIAHGEVGQRLSLVHRLIFVHIARSKWRRQVMFRAMRWIQANLPTLALRVLIQSNPPADRVILRQPHIADNLMGAIYEGMRPGAACCVQDLRLFFEPWDFAPQAIKAPCRIWQGDADNTVPSHAAEVLARLIPNCELTWLPQVGHYWVFDHFGEVLDWVAAQKY